MSNNSNRQTVIIIAGPTASGKSGRALQLAHEVGGIIINADSMQVYDAIPTLTACPEEDNLKAAPHRLYNFLHPSENCTAALWREKALVEIETAQKQGRTPIIVGGTGLYLKTLVEGISPVPQVPETVRAHTIELQKELGNPAFHEALSKRDPIMAERLHPNDTQRLTRAWETLEATGKSLAYWQAQPKEAPPVHLYFKIEKLIPERAKLYKNIERRFDQMLEECALDEVRDLMQLIERGEVPGDAPITGALGYKQLASYIRDVLPLDEAIKLAKTETRQYAKRQITWFRNQI